MPRYILAFALAVGAITWGMLACSQMHHRSADQRILLQKAK